jgi:hypothetical protein
MILLKPYSSRAESYDVIFATRQGLFHAGMPVHRVDEAWLRPCPVLGAKYTIVEPMESLNGNVDLRRERSESSSSNSSFRHDTQAHELTRLPRMYKTTLRRSLSYIGLHTARRHGMDLTVVSATTPLAALRAVWAVSSPQQLLRVLRTFTKTPHVQTLRMLAGREHDNSMNVDGLGRGRGPGPFVIMDQGDPRPSVAVAIAIREHKGWF